MPWATTPNGDIVRVYGKADRNAKASRKAARKVSKDEVEHEGAQDAALKHCNCHAAPSVLQGASNVAPEVARDAQAVHSFQDGPMGDVVDSSTDVKEGQVHHMLCSGASGSPTAAPA
ncbi:hypothetical protein V5799_010104 [Amblyomma americanum]|uniref:Uncharacterized protein n=1 Tax=Amblyomma americanum TaxID=6943 RepID=A0AAQ4F8K2_AMBAM